MQKKVTEPYLVDAFSFTEAEGRIIEEITPFISGEFKVSDIKRTNYSEIQPSTDSNADRWFKFKLQFIVLDEKKRKGKENSMFCSCTGGRLQGCGKKTGRKYEREYGGLYHSVM